MIFLMKLLQNSVKMIKIFMMNKSEDIHLYLIIIQKFLMIDIILRINEGILTYLKEKRRS